MVADHSNKIPERTSNYGDLYLEVRASKLVVNEINRAIAVKLHWQIRKYQGGYNDDVHTQGGDLTFLPSLSDIKEGINSIIEDFSVVEDDAPEWVNKIELPGEAEANTNIKILEEKIKTLGDEKNSEEGKLNVLSEYKKLLFLKGKTLELIVIKAFEYLGIQLKKTRNKRSRRWVS